MTTATLTKSRKSLKSGKGKQKPTKLIVPEYKHSEWQDCHAINAAGGLEMLEWQDGIMEGWLGVNRLGRWSAQTCAGSIPRQNGKTLGLVEARANYGMLIAGEEVIYTSHLQKTSTETFEDMANFFDSKPLRKYVKNIKTALGREQIILKNGARAKFLARTRNGGRGQHGDLLIFDEALELTAEQQASFLPAISASKNPQTIYISTPPTASSDGYVFRNIRERALEGESERTAWFEWSVDEIGDVYDRERWYATNPSLGILIQEDTVEAECEQMDADTFACERLGWWIPRLKAEHPIDLNAWDACATDTPNKEGVRVFAVKFSADGSSGCIAECRKPKEGKPFVYAIAQVSMSEGIGWFVRELTKRKDEAAQMVIDGQGNAQNLNDELLAAGISKRVIIRPRAADMVAASQMFANAVQDGELSHFNQPGLNEAVISSTKRTIGNYGGWGFQGEDAPLVEACALALWAAKNTKRDPNRKGRVGC